MDSLVAWAFPEIDRVGAVLGGDGGALGKQPAPPALVAALLAELGITATPTVLGVATAGRVNTTTAIEVDGTRFAVRVYGWPFGGVPEYDRRAKEVAWATRLAAADVPVAAFLATADVGGLQGALLEFVEGELLGTVAARDPAADLAEAWRGAGTALRLAHLVPTGVEGHGMLTADGLLPFPEGTFGRRIVAQTVHRARRLHGAATGGLVDAARVEALAPALEAALGTASTGLTHSDANPWNAMIRQQPTGEWRFAAWLDWEFAWSADPAYDLLRATEQRFADIGPTPESWWDGYGSRPDPLHHEAYGLHYLLWKAEERLDGLVWPETERVWAMLPSVPARLDRLAAALG